MTGTAWYDPPAEVPQPRPHPEPLQVATPGEYVTPAGVRSWGTLRARLAAGWRMSERRAVGWTLKGTLVESIALRFEHVPTRTRAVSVLSRPLREIGPCVTGARLRGDEPEPIDAWAHDVSFVWPADPFTGGAWAFPYEVGSRALTAALQTVPDPGRPLVEWCARKPLPKKPATKVVTSSTSVTKGTT